MTLPQVLGLLFLGSATVAILLVAAYALSLRFRGAGRGSSGIDEYLRSGLGNSNPSHIPPSYSVQADHRGSVMTSHFGRIGTGSVNEHLDNPSIQKAKFEAAQTTTSEELRSIDR